MFLAKCEIGHYLNREHSTCEPCGYGFYQSQPGSFDCIPCGIGKTTLEITAISEEDCRDECPGKELI